MLAIFISWVIITFILFTFGDMLLVLFNKICGQNEEARFLDRLLLGLCSIIIPLSIWSLWLPSNKYFLFTTIIISCIYWAINYEKARQLFSRIKKGLHLKAFVITGGIFILISLYFFAWEQEVYDSLFYHHQNIRWNEEFAVVPGLGILDDRYGFNSNYFLLSAVFTFRFVLGEAIYPIQSLFVSLIGCWILYELYKSDYDIKRIILLLSYIILYWVSIYFLGNTSTDILPNFITFYLISKIILYANSLKTNYLFYIIIPAFLLTCKLSFFPIGFISIYVLYNLLKEKKYQPVSFSVLISLFIILPWLIRNVIISGYLIYPLYQIDLFDVDWKIPREIAVSQKEYIFEIGYYFFRIALRYPHMSIRDPLVVNILTYIIYILTLSSLSYFTYHLIKKGKYIEKHLLLLYIIFILSLIVWATGGPDIRFISGILCSIIFTGCIIITNKKNSNIHLPKLSKVITFCFIISIALWVSHNFYKTLQKDTVVFCHITKTPYSIKDQLKAKNIELENTFTAYPINNNLVIWLNPEFTYDKLPSRIKGHYSLFLPIECIEARGNTLQEGFKVKDYQKK